jgi:ATP-binding cassette subfamily A (ABC1) protein 3
MLIYFVLIGVVTGLSMLVMPSSGARKNSVSKALFNYTHWTLLWTILFVYSIQVSAFSVFFGQFFKHGKIEKKHRFGDSIYFIFVAILAQLLGFIIWVITFIDFYPGVPVGVRYFLCLFPNTGLLFCLEVVLQYERKSCEFYLFFFSFGKNLKHLAGMVTFQQLYSNLFTYPLYIGFCLLLMLIYSVIYLLLAIYIERINPGEFGVAQPWNYLFKKSYWKPYATSTVHPLNTNGTLANQNGGLHSQNHWIQLNPIKKTKNPSVTISHLTKVNDYMFLFSVLAPLFM